MSKTTQRQRNLTVTDKLTLSPNAVFRVKRKGNEGYDTVYPPTANYAELKATKTVLARESGTHFVLNTVTGFATTLPVPAVGLEYFFHIGATEPTTSHTVVTNASANIINGNLASPDMNAASDVTVTADADTISFIASKALHGDFAHVWSDGTNWYLDGMCKAFDGMTTTQAS